MRPDEKKKASRVIQIQTPPPATVGSEPAGGGAAGGSPRRSPASGGTGFGIRETIELMRKLPDADNAIVVQVMKITLESNNVDVGAIIDQAKARERATAGEIARCQREIADLEGEVAHRRGAIRALRGDFAETTEVGQRLEAAGPFSGRG